MRREWLGTFDDPSRRTEARRRIAEQKPMFLVGSPMCKAFCNWQKLNASKRDPAVVAREWNKAIVHLEFVCQLYKEQVAGGRFFLHEHPATASSWQERCIAEVLELPRVARAVGDQCQYGQRSRRGAPVKKPMAGCPTAKKSCASCPQDAVGRMASAATHRARPTRCAQGEWLPKRPYIP